ncbi:helix-turn-helix domain-containing GNAT family N-acetyltransferase [Actinomycetes bacterium KLBMP 9759]
MDSGMVAQVRSFNRTVTQRVGALDEAYLSRGRPLGQARLLWEISESPCEVRALRARLDLDSGYLSRLLAALQKDGLVAVETDPDDARVRTARLTPAGRAERAELDRLSDELAQTMIRPLNGEQRGRLVAAMAEVERLLVASMVDVSVTDPRHPDAQLCMSSYYDDLATRFETGFDPAATRPAEDDAITLLVARLHEEPVGCGALKAYPTERCADVKRMWVSPTVRGLGVGRRLLAELEKHARGLGVRTLRLETNKALVEAIGLYRAAGFVEVEAFNDEPYAHHWFTKTLD